MSLRAEAIVEPSLLSLQQEIENLKRVVNDYTSTHMYDAGRVSGTFGSLTFKAGWLVDASNLMGAKVYLNTPQALVNNTLTVVKFDTVVWDPTSSYSAAAGTYTIQPGQDGYYLVMALLAFAVNAVGRRNTMILLNGVAQATGNEVAPAAGSGRVAISAALKLVAGDVLSIQALQDSGGNLNVGVGDLTTTLTVVRLF